MITPKFFEEYDANNNQLNSLNSASTDLANTNTAIQQLSQQIRNAQQQLGSMTAQENACSQRLYRNEHPHFLHFFVQNRHQKIETLKSDLNNMNEKHASLEASISSMNQKKQTLEANLGNLTQRKQIFDSCVAKRQTMFNEVIESVPMTPRMQQIEQKAQQAQQVLSQEQALIQTLTQVITSVKQAQGLFEQSLNGYSRAAMWNNRAMYDDQWDGAGYFERRDQYRRDMLINQARNPAMQAYDVASRGFQMFPDVLRQRFPEAGAQIGHVPLPTLQMAQYGNTMQADMFGYAGAAINDMNSGCAIQQNQQAVSQCIQILQNQLAHCNSILGALNANLNNLKGSAHTLGQQRDAERVATFEVVRESVCHPGVANMGHLPVGVPAN